MSRTYTPGDLVAVPGLPGARRVFTSRPASSTSAAAVTVLRSTWERDSWATRSPGELELILAADPSPGVSERWVPIEPDPYAERSVSSSAWLVTLEGPLVDGDLCELGASAGYLCGQDAVLTAQDNAGREVLVCAYHAERQGLIPGPERASWEVRIPQETMGRVWDDALYVTAAAS